MCVETISSKSWNSTQMALFGNQLFVDPGFVAGRLAFLPRLGMIRAAGYKVSFGNSTIAWVIPRLL